MRPPPKIPPIITGEKLEPTIRRTLAAMNALAEWMNEASEAIAPATQSQQPGENWAKNVWTVDQHRDCPDCTDTQPCDRARALTD